MQLLYHRQARFTQRLYSRPSNGQGLEEILTRERSALTRRLRATLPPGETVEAEEWELVGASPAASSLKREREPSRDRT